MHTAACLRWVGFAWLRAGPGRPAPPKLAARSARWTPAPRAWESSGCTPRATPAPPPQTAPDPCPLLRAAGTIARPRGVERGRAKFPAPRRAVWHLPPAFRSPAMSATLALVAVLAATPAPAPPEVRPQFQHF